MLGGGTFISMAKVLPGTYVNFKSAIKTEEVSLFGYVGLCQSFYGEQGKLITVKADEIQESDNCLKNFGYNLTDIHMTWLRELIKGGAKVLYIYNALSGGTQAANTYAAARYKGIRGNDIKIAVEEQVDNTYTVTTLIDSEIVDTQNVASASVLKDNEYVTFKKDSTLSETSGLALTGGADGTETGTTHENFINTVEPIYTNVIVCTSLDSTTKLLYSTAARSFTENTGNKALWVIFNCAADYPSVYNITCEMIAVVDGTGINGLVYWFGGKLSNAYYNYNLCNKLYDGELTVSSSFTQSQLKDAITSGKIVLHKVGDDFVIMDEVTSYVSYTEDLSKDFHNGQHVRIVFGVSIMQGNEFNTHHLAVTPNNENGKAVLWTAMTNVLNNFVKDNALQYDTEDVTVEEVDRESVVLKEAYKTVVAMKKLYIQEIVN